MIEIIEINTPTESLQNVADLIRQYNVELNENLCFQNIDEELNNLLKKYGPPNGSLITAYYNEQLIGCVALQQKNATTCEMKRLYVLPEYRKLGAGKLLAIAIIEQAKKLGYTTMVLDTLERLTSALQLYQQLGFVNTTAYYNNPLPNVVYLKKDL
jgi:putative acetyltransferase